MRKLAVLTVLIAVNAVLAVSNPSSADEVWQICVKKDTATGGCMEMCESRPMSHCGEDPCIDACTGGELES